jgi:tRNA pseudouridine38-40 synthase
VTLFPPEAGTQPDPAPPLVRVRALIAYDGRGYHGFAAQPGVKTVGGTIITTLSRVLRHPVELTCAGRTDTGVHAWGQVVSFDVAEDRFDPDTIVRAGNKLMAPTIVVRSVERAEPGFDARRWAKARTYRYSVVNRSVPDPFLAATAWHVEEELDVRAMQLACDPLIGEHDFSSFCRPPRGTNGGDPPSMVRKLQSAEWRELGDGILRFEVRSSSFCHQMVRSLVGTMVEMGRGRRRAGEMAAILRAESRAAAGHLAPPHGLCLWHVDY